MAKKFTAVISNYAPRGNHNALRLAEEVSGLVDEVFIVVNDDNCKALSIREGSQTVIRRPNIGMNIGAWSAAIAYCDSNSDVIFLQDECRVVNPNFVERYQRFFANKKVGMVGESLNLKWNRSWDAMAKSPLNYWLTEEGRYEKRIDFYLRCLRSWNIDLGSGGLHLRALIWSFSSDALRKIQRFPQGRKKEECIAAEVAVSKLVNQLGFEFVQSDPTPFSFFRHEEWEPDGSHKKLTF
jgi:hypothetical protein